MRCLLSFATRLCNPEKRLCEHLRPLRLRAHHVCAVLVLVLVRSLCGPTSRSAPGAPDLAQARLRCALSEWPRRAAFSHFSNAVSHPPPPHFPAPPFWLLFPHLFPDLSPPLRKTEL